MRRRFDLTDFEWAIIEPLLPNKPRGVPRVDDRRVLKGYCGGFAQVALGLTFPSAMGHIRSATPLRPLPEGSIFLADKAYDSDAIRETVEALSTRLWIAARPV